MLHRQHLVYLTFMNYTIVCLQLLPGGFSEAGRDLWISFTVSGGIGLFIALVVWHFDRRFPGHTLPEILREQAPFVVRSLILSVSALYTLFLCAVTTTQLSEFINIGFLQETPFWVVTLSFVITVTHAFHKGLQDIANTAAVLTFVTAVSGTTMSFAISGNRHLDNMLPIGARGMNGIFMGVLYCLPIWVELFLVPLFPRKESGTKGWLSAYVGIVLLNFVVLIGHILSPMSVFGMEQTLNLQFPLLSSVKTISLGYIDRFDVYGLALMIFGSYIRVSTYLVLTWTQVQSLLRIRLTSWIPSGVSVAVLGTATLLLFQNSPLFHALSGLVFAYVGLGMFCFFTCIYLALGLTNARDGRKQNHQSGDKHRLNRSRTSGTWSPSGRPRDNRVRR